MKRVICILLTLALLMCLGCGSVSGTLGYDTKNLKLINEYLEEADTILLDVKSTIEWQISVTNEEIDAMKNSTIAQAEYSDDSFDEIRAMADELDGHITQFEKMKDRVDAIAMTDIVEVDDTIAAAQHYFSKTTAALKDLMRIYDFYFDLEAALRPLSEFDYTLYTDYDSMIADMYYACGDVMENLNAIDCPPFMEQTFAHFVRHFGLYNTVLETSYTVVCLQYYGVNDVLRAYSIDALIERLDLQMTEYTILLSEDINHQYKKVLERLNTSLAVLNSELKTNIGKLIKHAG